MKQNGASRKLNAQAQAALANVLLFDVSDPRLRMVTITGCEVSFDRSFCNVFYTAPVDEYEDVQAALSSAKGRIRSCLAKQLTWRVTPELRFLLDESVDQAQRIAQALAVEEARVGEHVEDAVTQEDE